MAKKTRSTSTRAAKQRRQVKARTSRNMPDMPRLVTSPAEARAALETAAAAGHFTVANPDGTTHQVTMQQIRHWHDTTLTAAGEPPLEPGELAEILTHDFMFGRLRLRTDGLWESDNGYLTGGQP